MPPLPKPSRLRQRTNSRPSVVLPATSGREVPPLPGDRVCWTPQARAWWSGVWSSPMASQYLDADVHQLAVLLELVELYWQAPSLSLAAEIRVASQSWGLDPVSRRRLGWEVAQSSTEPEPERVTPVTTPTDADDPRRAVLGWAPRRTTEEPRPCA